MNTGTATATKTILIAFPGTEGKQEQPVTIVPGTTPHDILTQLKLTGFNLARPGGSGMFMSTEDLFPLVAEGQKVHATKSDVEAGDR